MKMLHVEVVYATPEQQRIFAFEVSEGSTIENVIKSSGILEFFPEIDLNRQQVGVFSQARQLTDKVKDGDRIEIYRDLLIDPKDARRTKARRKL